MREQGSGTRIAMERFFAEHNIHLIGGMEMDSSEAIKQGVQAGLGLGIVSIHTINLEIEVKRLAILDVASLPIIRQWYLVHPRDKRLSPVAQAFKEFILNEAKGLLEAMRGGEFPARASKKSKQAKTARQHPYHQCIKTDPKTCALQGINPSSCALPRYRRPAPSCDGHGA